MANNNSYNQWTKRSVRHRIIRSAIEKLTVYRKESACIRRDYVRDVYDYFTQNDDLSGNKAEANKIEMKYIIDWERLHDSYIGKKDIQDLTVCYLCGPEPNNDFQEFVNLGILPQNIWAFESSKKIYDEAIKSYDNFNFPQPRIIRQNIETFFKVTPKKFDIVYIDACGSVPSEQHALRCLTTLITYARLYSPGIVISNFSSPDIKNEDISEYVDLISAYLFFKDRSDEKIDIQGGKIHSDEFSQYVLKVNSNFSLYYGNFISAVLRDIPSIIVPVQRIQENPFFSRLTSSIQLDEQNLSILFNEAEGCSLGKFFTFCGIQKFNGTLSKKADMFLKELKDFDAILKGIGSLISLHNTKGHIYDEFYDIRKYFEKNSFHQFLDKHHSNLVFDAIMNQLIYPMHFSPWNSQRFRYIAKTREMYTDVSVYDECRYFYEWIPAIDQVVSAYSNLSWQYVFRFAMDGLIKSRFDFNNEFFYQGSVVPVCEESFEVGKILNREQII